MVKLVGSSVKTLTELYDLINILLWLELLAETFLKWIECVQNSLRIIF